MPGFNRHSNTSSAATEASALVAMVAAIDAAITAPPSNFFECVDEQKSQLLRCCRPSDMLALKLHALRLVNLLVNKYEYLRGARHKIGRPIGFMLDPANACQLGCPTCQHSFNRDYAQRTYVPMRKGLMDPAAFDTLLPVLGLHAFVGHFYNNSEPFLNKHTCQFLARANQYRINTLISSNLGIPGLDAVRIVDSGLNTLMVAIDGVTQDVYAKYRRGGRLDVVFDNIERIVVEKRRRGARTPHLRWQFLLFEHNAHEASRAEALAQQLGFDSFNVAAPYDVSGDAPDVRLAASEQAGRTVCFTEQPQMNAWPRPLQPIADVIEAAWSTRYAKRHRALRENMPTSPEPRFGHCDWLHLATVVDAHGEISPCCIPNYVSHPRSRFGSIGIDKAEYFNSEGYLRARDLLAAGPAATASPATKCDLCTHRPEPQVGLPSARTYLSTPTDASYGNWLDAESIDRLTNWSRHTAVPSLSIAAGNGDPSLARLDAMPNRGNDSDSLHPNPEKRINFLMRLFKRAQSSAPQSPPNEESDAQTIASTQEQDRLLDERRVLSEERDRMLEERRVLIEERDALVQERNQLGELRYIFEHERDVARAKIDELIAELARRPENTGDAAAPAPGSALVQAAGATDARELLIFLHVAKTGGLTLGGILNRQFTPEQILTADFGATDSALGLWKDDPFGARFASLSLEQQSTIAYLAGHFMFGVHRQFAKSARYITMLRNPVDRVVSSYYYLLSRPEIPVHDTIVGNNMSLVDYIESGVGLDPHNYQTRVLAGLPEYDATWGETASRVDMDASALEVAKRNLVENFALAGTTERFDDFLLTLKLQHGWPLERLLYTKENETQSRPSLRELSPAVIARIEEANRLDMELYQFVRERFSAVTERWKAEIDYLAPRFRLVNALYALEAKDGRPTRSDAIRLLCDDIDAAVPAQLGG